MPMLIAALGPLLITLLRMYLVSMIGRVLLTLGIGLFTYKVAGPELVAWIGSQFHALPEFIRQSVAASGIDKYATMVFSALVVKKTASVFFGSVS